MPDGSVCVKVVKHRAGAHKSFLSHGVPPFRLSANVFRKEREGNTFDAVDEERLLAPEVAIHRRFANAQLPGKLVQTHAVVPALREEPRGMFEDAPADGVSVAFLLHPRAAEMTANARERQASFAECTDLPQSPDVL